MTTPRTIFAVLAAGDAAVKVQQANKEAAAKSAAAQPQVPASAAPAAPAEGDGQSAG